MAGKESTLSRGRRTGRKEMTDEESYIHYLVLVRFDKDDGDLRARDLEALMAERPARAATPRAVIQELRDKQGNP
jgi:hypothetical protein